MDVLLNARLCAITTAVPRPLTNQWKFQSNKFHSMKTSNNSNTLLLSLLHRHRHIPSPRRKSQRGSLLPRHRHKMVHSATQAVKSFVYLRVNSHAASQRDCVAQPLLMNQLSMATHLRSCPLPLIHSKSTCHLPVLAALKFATPKLLAPLSLHLHQHVDMAALQAVLLPATLAVAPQLSQLE